MKFEKHLRSSNTLNLQVFLKHFIKRSIWKYLLGAVLLGVSFPNLFGGMLKTVVLLWILIVLIASIIIYFSIKSMSRFINFDADVIFDDEIITINHRNQTNNPEQHSWHWIREVKQYEGALLLRINASPSFVILINSKELDAEQIDFIKYKVGKTIKG